MKLKWFVESAPTGKFRSFQKRGWPYALNVESDKVAVMLYCDDDYFPPKVKTGDHGPITIHVRRLVDGKLKTYVLRQKATTLPEAKAIAAKFFSNNPTWEI